MAEINLADISDGALQEGIRLLQDVEAELGPENPSAGRLLHELNGAVLLELLTRYRLGRTQEEIIDSLARGART